MYVSVFVNNLKVVEEMRTRSDSASVAVASVSNAGVTQWRSAGQQGDASASDYSVMNHSSDYSVMHHLSSDDHGC